MVGVEANAPRTRREGERGEIEEYGPQNQREDIGWWCACKEKENEDQNFHELMMFLVDGTL